MSDNNNNNEGPGLVPAAFISLVLLYFVASAFGPLLMSMDFASTSPSSNDLSLGDSVVTREKSSNEKLNNYQSKFDALSPAKVQEKLSNLPVFYLSGSGSDGIGDSFYMSFNEAQNAATSSSGSEKVVKVTTLDQVMYPLILKKGAAAVKTNKSTPAEVKSARDAVASGDETTPSTYNLVPSKAALNDATEMTLKQGDAPLFVVERLAFAGNDGRPQVPLFTERNDALVSYARLRESGGNKLPEEPSVRTTSLLDVLDSMEGGTRPAVGQLVFYGNADDVLKADEMSR